MKAKTILVSLCLAALFCSCHDDIYGSINNEVELESSGLQGDMSYIARFGDYIVIANGDIYYKTNEPSTTTGLKNGQWKRMANPTNEKGDYDVPATTYFVASDASYLYALTYVWQENDDGENEPQYARLYYTDSVTGSWTLLDLVDAGVIDNWNYGNVKILFDNQYCGTMDADDDSSDDSEETSEEEEDTDDSEETTDDEEDDSDSTDDTSSSDDSSDEDDEDAYKDLSKRNAYIRVRQNSLSDYTLYLLSGDSAEEVATGASFVFGDRTNAIKACYFQGTDYFSRGYSMTSNQNYLYFTGSYTSGNNVAGSSVLYYYDGGSTIYETNLSAGSLLSVAAAKDYILLGTSSGLGRATLNGDFGEPTGGTPDFDNNGDSVISEYVFMVFVLDPSKCENNSTKVTNEDGETEWLGTDEYGASVIKGSIRSSSDSWDDTGLYAYYPSRDEWNRDGD